MNLVTSGRASRTTPIWTARRVTYIVVAAVDVRLYTDTLVPAGSSFTFVRIAPMITRLVHIGLTVSDMKTMRDFYTRVLGLVEDGEVPHPKGGTIIFLKAADGEVLEMINYSNAKPHDGRDKDRTGLHHFGLLVDDIKKEVERLIALGVEFDGTVKVNTSRDLAVHFWDPEGNRIHLTQESKK